MKQIIYTLLLSIALASCTSQVNKHSSAPLPQDHISTATNPAEQVNLSYQQTLAQRDALAAQIEDLTAEAGSAKKSKAKKINQEIQSLTSQLEATERLLAAYPQSVSNPQAVVPPTVVTEKETFQKELDRRLEQKKETVADPDAALLEDITDPELRRAYQNYLKNEREGKLPKESQSNSATVDPKLYFSVRIGTGNRGQAKSYVGLSDVQEHRSSDTRSVYTSGRFATEAQAKKHCDMVKLDPKYRSAYIVGVRNSQIISLDQARQLVTER